MYGLEKINKEAWSLGKNTEGKKKKNRPDQISIFQNSPNIFTSYEVEVNSDFKMADMNSASSVPRPELGQFIPMKRRDDDFEN